MEPVSDAHPTSGKAACPSRYFDLVLRAGTPKRLRYATHSLDLCHHGVQFERLNRGGVQLGLDLSVALSEGVLIDIANGVARCLEQGKDFLARFGLLRTLANDVNRVRRLTELLLQRLSIDGERLAVPS